ncbi:YbjN domain-containing protein [Candidatus Chlorohelix sp.]|uniref:YbjN domain-containing protein n=1 Tax=Candidatus Chlorohelix sp. TaxID=3139201 RepID=UPI0030271CD4
MFQTPIYQALVNFFNTEEWSFIPKEDEPTLRLWYQGTSGQWVCYAKVREEQKQVFFYSVSPVVVPENKFGAVTELINRINCNLVFGNFALDYEDGTFHFRTCLLFDNTNPSTELLRKLVFFNVMLMDEYLQSVMQALYTDASPAEVFRQSKE